MWGWTWKRTFAEIVFTGFAKLLRWLSVMTFAVNSCLLPCKAFAAIALPSFVYDLSVALEWKKDFCWNCLYRFRKAFAVIAMTFAVNSCLLPCKAFAAIAPRSLIYNLSERLDFKKDFCWNCLYRFLKAFAVIASNCLCCEQLSFILRSFGNDCYL